MQLHTTLFVQQNNQMISAISLNTTIIRYKQFDLNVC